MTDFFKDFKQVAQNRSIVDVISVLFSDVKDMFFDSTYKVSTQKRVRGDKNFDSKPYAPTRAAPFERLLKQLSPSLDHVFVDLGCGKGRILFLALNHGIHFVKGIDYNKTLIKIAEENLGFFFDQDQYQLLIEDLTQYRFLPEDSFFYLYDPIYSDSMLNSVVQRIKGHNLNNPKLRKHVVYHNNLIKNPSFDSLLDEWDKSLLNFSGNQFFVYIEK